MHFLIALAVAAAAVLHTLLAPPRSADADPATSCSCDPVIDGDTIVVSTFGRVRLLGIDAPEIGHGGSTPRRRSGTRRAIG